MTAVNAVTIAVALIAGICGVLAQRTAARANRINGQLQADAQKAAAEASKDNTRTDAEKEAYQRARKMDVETIQRQDVEMEELRAENAETRSQLAQTQQQLRALQVDHATLLRDNSNLHLELRTLRTRLARLENKQPPQEGS